MKVDVARDGELVILRPEGDLDAAVAPAVRCRLAELTGAGHTRFVVDLEAVEFLDSAGVATLVQLYKRVRERLAGANWLRIIGDAPDKGAILAFAVEGAHAHDVAQILDRYGVAVRAGTHCAEPLMKRFGVTSSARASFALYNTEAEADAFVDALTKTQAFFA